VKQRATETADSYQNEKAEIEKEVERMEMAHLQEVNNVRDKGIDCEMDTKRLKADCAKM